MGNVMGTISWLSQVHFLIPRFMAPSRSMRWLLQGFSYGIAPVLHRHPLTEGPNDGVLAGWRLCRFLLPALRALFLFGLPIFKKNRSFFPIFFFFLFRNFLLNRNLFFQPILSHFFLSFSKCLSKTLNNLPYRAQSRALPPNLMPHFFSRPPRP